MTRYLRLFLYILTIGAWSEVRCQPPDHQVSPDTYYTDLLGGRWCDAPGTSPDLFAAYFQGYEDFLRTALHGGDSAFSVYFDRMEDRLAAHQGDTPFELYLQAEFTLQTAFIELKAGNELAAAWKLRQAYKKATGSLEQHPDYGPLRKSLGIMQCLIGAIPENMQWIPGVFGIRGSIDEGMGNIAQACKETPWLCRETDFLLSLCYSYLLSENDKAIAYGEHALSRSGPAPLPVYLMMNIYLRSHRAAQALDLADQLQPAPCGEIPQINYLRGNALLQKGEYAQARIAFRTFLDHHTSQDFVKDAWYKSGLTWWLEENKTKALQHFTQARIAGLEETEADRYAAKHASQPLPEPQILKVRLFTDGGYYDEARKQLDRVSPEELSDPEAQVELIYRKARLAHLSGDTLQAIASYKNTIMLQGQDSWYFAPNSCLQLGYLLAQKDKDKARYWFGKVGDYKGYEYEKGIERKAQAALNHLN